MWYDGEIIPGTEWEKDIKKQLHSADIILLLMSADSLSSDYFYDEEMADALKRHESEQAIVIPVILRHCSWEDTPLHNLQALPDNAKPINEWPQQSAAYKSIVDGIKNSMQLVRERKKAAEEKKRKEEEERKWLAEEKKRKEEEERQRLEEEKKRKEEEERKWLEEEKKRIEEEERKWLAEEKKRKEEEERQRLEEEKKRKEEEERKWLAEEKKRIEEEERQRLEEEKKRIEEEERQRLEEEKKRIEEEEEKRKKHLALILAQVHKAHKSGDYGTAKRLVKEALVLDNSNTEVLQIARETIDALRRKRNKGIATFFKFALGTLVMVAGAFGVYNLISRQAKTVVIEVPNDEIGKNTPKKASIEPIKQNSLPEPLQRLLDDMVSIKGGVFIMGCTDEKIHCQDDEKPPHAVTLGDFNIGKYEVTQEQWEAVMRNNPSHFRNCGSQCPVENVSWNDIQKFIEKLNSKTGQTFRLPTEAEWEYVAKGGSRSNSYWYAGGNVLNMVARYRENSKNRTHTVGSMGKVNELGLHDINGNVWEWCQDSKREYSKKSQQNPKGPSSERKRVLRGGSYHSMLEACRVTYRSVDGEPSNKGKYYGFRIASSIKDNWISIRKAEQQKQEKYNRLVKKAENKYNSNDYSSAKVLYKEALTYISTGSEALNGITLCDKALSPLRPRPNTPLGMVYVQGGEFTMGCVADSCYTNEIPSHRVTLSDFYIGEHEVTNQQYSDFLNANGNQAESGIQWYEIESYYAKIEKIDSSYAPKPSHLNDPVMEVSWYGAKAYCDWMTRKTERKYRLPTEAEWEYAAKEGGKKILFAGTKRESSLYEYANFCDVNCEYSEKDESQNDNYARTAPVGQLLPNALGLYDMSGNVWEWCSDWYGEYSIGEQQNPTGPDNGSKRVARGGGWSGKAEYCRISYRGSGKPTYRSNACGFRVVSPID